MRDDGVEFSSVYDGSRHVFTPELAMRIQEELGADVIMAFDQCAPGTLPHSELEAAVERTTRWAAACKEAHGRRDQLLIGIVQGGADEALRRRSAAEITGVGFDAYAIGGLSVGERGDEMLATVELMDELLPGDRLRYFMGIGDPSGIVDVIAPRRRRVRLRAADAPGAHGHGAPARGWPAEPAQRPVRRRAGAARGRLRLLHVPHVHALVPAPPGDAEGDARRAAPESSQPARSAKIDEDARRAIRAGRFAEFANDVAGRDSAGG